MTILTDGQSSLPKINTKPSKVSLKNVLCNLMQRNGKSAGENLADLEGEVGWNLGVCVFAVEALWKRGALEALPIEWTTWLVFDGFKLRVTRALNGKDLCSHPDCPLHELQYVWLHQKNNRTALRFVTPIPSPGLPFKVYIKATWSDVRRGFTKIGIASRTTFGPDPLAGEAEVIPLILGDGPPGDNA